MNFKNYFILYLFIFSLFITSYVSVGPYNSLGAVEVSSVTHGDTFIMGI